MIEPFLAFDELWFENLCRHPSCPEPEFMVLPENWKNKIHRSQSMIFKVKFIILSFVRTV